jgi:hypothetical protein
MDPIEIVKLLPDNLFVGTYFNASLQIVNENQINKIKTVFVVETNEKTLGSVRSS